MVMLRKISELLQRPDCILNKSFRLQLLLTLVVNIITFSHGISVGWLSPTLSKLITPDSPLSFMVAINEVSWIGSLVGLGCLAGNIFYGFMLDITGRKFCVYSLAVPHMILWALIYSAQSVEFLYVARFFGGVCGGGIFSVISLFISEIADISIRGTLSSILMLAVNSGILVGFILGTHLSYHIIPLTVIVLPVLFIVLVTFFPDSPNYLIQKGNFSAAEDSFKFYKNCSKAKNYDDLQKCNNEFDELKTALIKEKSGDSLSYKDFITKRVLKASCTALVLLFVNQFCCIFAFVNYMSRIFTLAGSVLDPNTSTIVTGCMQICGSYAATIFVDRFGRKVLLSISTLGMSLTMTLFGFYTYFSQFYDLTDFNWTPLLLMMIFIFVGNLGIVGVSFVVLIEIFPAKIRSIAISVCMGGLSIMIFLVLKVFPIYLETFGISITMWSCAAVNLTGFIYFLIFLPETKGRSLMEDVD